MSLVSRARAQQSKKEALTLLLLLLLPLPLPLPLPLLGPPPTCCCHHPLATSFGSASADRPPAQLHLHITYTSGLSGRGSRNVPAQPSPSPVHTVQLVVHCPHFSPLQSASLHTSHPILSHPRRCRRDPHACCYFSLTTTHSTSATAAAFFFLDPSPVPVPDTRFSLRCRSMVSLAPRNLQPRPKRARPDPSLRSN